MGAQFVQEEKAVLGPLCVTHLSSWVHLNNLYNSFLPFHFTATKT